eukprot:TRINITY_DN30202_c0_g1_i1.p1 TRINITY_DN30202_c0_g1~~TRINITY_DN30202_c0_g1_i1.p1  ORF type:complete len:600 (-),score=57.77 TRINITY_DN30202_c0_g1_i1:199-1941(-)
MECFGKSWASCAEANGTRHRARRVRLRAARAVCTRLLQNADVLQDPDAPVEQLLIAEQNLRAIEAWISGGKCVRTASASVIRALGGLASPEDEDRFFSTFFPPLSGERLVRILTCTVMWSSFKIPGRIYLSSARICFESFVITGDTQFSVVWPHVSYAKLKSFNDSSCSSPVSTKRLANPVRIGFTCAVPFSGEEVSELELRFLDLEALGQLHRCACYFIGSGLFDMQQDEAAVCGKGSPQKDKSIMDMAQKQIRQVAVWQLQRRTTIWHTDWRAPFLPHDGHKRCSWTSIQDDDYARHPSLPDGARRSCATPPIPEVSFMGKPRACKWQVIADAGGGGADEEGWQYAVDFYLSEESWTPAPASFSHVRRRLWHPVFDHQAAQPAKRKKSTLLAEKGLHHSSGAAQQLFSADIGLVSLDVLGKEFEADQWTEPGGLMFEFFHTISKAKDLDIGPWASRHSVEGLVRDVQMRVPVPPAPMCPEHTRVTSTWHVVRNSSRVVLESVIMSLDVPYGDCFRIITVDTFTVDEASSTTRMVRVMELEWLKSTWIKSLIETSVHTEVTAAGKRWSKLIGEWVRRCT